MTKKKRIIFSREPEKFIARVIARFVRENAGNRRKVDGGRYWEKPLVGFAAGDDPLFREYKKVIGTFHFTPFEIFERTFGKKKLKQLSVISWVLPAAEDIRKSNRKETRLPSLLWAHARNFGEQFNVRLRDSIVAFLKKRGYRALAPMNSPHFKRLRSRRVGWASNWSERHAAYACGLGTFGLGDGLITPKGASVRIGSVITDLPLKPTPRIYPHRQANCLYFFNKTCRVCAARCPAGAISARGHDKDKCEAYIRSAIGPFKESRYGVKISGCGLCQTKVPCEFEIPKAIRKGYKKNQV